MMEKTQGLIIVHTGNGKGKTTAALGLGLRAWGQGLKVLVLQFIKGNWKYGELTGAKNLGERFVMRPMGEGFVKKSKDGDKMEEHRAAAIEALEEVRKEMKNSDWDMIILDEINYAVAFGLIKEEDALDLIERKPSFLHLVLTGRDARPAIVERADLVTEMMEVKHPLQRGIKAQKGIEF